MATWADVLDTLERQLVRQERAYRSSGTLPDTLVFPTPETPMSDSERVRAAALVQRTDSLITEVLEGLKARRPHATPYG